LTKKATTRSRWQYDTIVINQTKKFWLKNDDKEWSTKVDSHDMDKHNEEIDLNVDSTEFMDSPKKLAAKIISTLK
jgi:hypothetical protein